MLLQRLREYAETREDLPPAMYQTVFIRYVLQLSNQGEPLALIDLATQQQKRGLQKKAPDCVRSSGDRPILFADHAEYTFGLPREQTEKNIASARRRFHLYQALVEACANTSNEESVSSVLHFLRNTEPGRPPVNLPEDFDPTGRISFEVMLETQHIWPIDLPAVRSFWANTMASGDTTRIMQCLICGEERPPVASLPVQIQGIPGGQPTGMALISANEEAFESYGLERSRIAPTCEECGHRVGTALNVLLKQRETHLTVKSLAYVFWTSRPVAFDFSSMLTQADPTEVRQFLTSPWRGKESTIETTHFYAAALSANNARIVVRDWVETTLDVAQDHLQRYFQIQEIVDRAGEPRWFPLWQLVEATLNKTQKQPDPLPRAEEALLHLAFHGGSLPPWLLYQVLRRVRAEHDVRPAQAALIKMVLLSTRTTDRLGSELQPAQGEREQILVELDLISTDKAYLCGRLFAQLEEIEYQAMGEISNTITDRYFGTALSAPASVFGRLLRRAHPHLSKLAEEKRGAFYRLDESLQQILACFEDKTFPTILTLIEQGRFTLGYYQQKAANRQAARQGAAKKADAQQTETPAK